MGLITPKQEQEQEQEHMQASRTNAPLTLLLNFHFSNPRTHPCHPHDFDIWRALGHVMDCSGGSLDSEHGNMGTWTSTTTTETKGLEAEAGPGWNEGERTWGWVTLQSPRREINNPMPDDDAKGSLSLSLLRIFPGPFSHPLLFLTLTLSFSLSFNSCKWTKTNKNRPITLQSRLHFYLQSTPNGNFNLIIIKKLIWSDY